MYTECPSCNTFFRISSAHLKAADGKVRCGSCNTIFNARENLFDELPTAIKPRQAQGEARRQQRQELSGFDDSGLSGDDTEGFEIAPDEEPLADLLDADDEAIAKDLAAMDDEFDGARLGDDDSDFSRGVDDTRSRLEDFGDAGDILDEVRGEPSMPLLRLISGIVWTALIAGLAVVLVGQYAYFQRVELAKDPTLRPWLEKMCGVVNQYAPCEIPEPRNIKAIKLKGEVRSDSETPNTLVITAVMVNEAPFDQPFPKMILLFSDINQKAVAQSSFTPREYLGANVDIKAGIKRGESVNFTIRIKDPGKDAVNFSFDVE